MKEKLRSIFCLVAVIFLSFWAIKPLLHPGFFPMHDDTQVARVYEMSEALKSGQFPVRWVGDLGYGFGYPIFNFYAPLPYYIGASFNLIGFDVLTATKIMIAGGIILSGMAMFLLLKNITSYEASVAGSLLYTYAPYHAVDAYVRGAVGELYAMVFLPLLMLGIIKILRSYYSSSDPDLASGKSRSFISNSSRQARTIRQGILIGSLSFAGILLSHNILGMITGYFLGIGLFAFLIYSVIARLRSSRGNLLEIASHPLAMTNRVFYCLLFTVLLGLGLSSFFVIPAILEKNYTRVNQLTEGTNNFSNHFVYPDQLWSSPWGFAGSAPGRLDGMSFMIGKIQLLLGVFSILIFFIFYKKKKIDNFQFSIFNFQLFLFLLSIFFMLEISKPLWNILPGFSFIQYPWRFLAFTSLSLPIIISIVLGYVNRKFQIIISMIIIVAVVWFNSRYFVPKEYLSVKASDYINEANLRFNTSKISDEYLPINFTIPKTIDEAAWSALTPNFNLQVLSKSESPTRKTFQVYNAEKGKILANIAYFPGWQVKIDDRPVSIKSFNGLIEFELPKGIHKIELIFLDTMVRIISNAIAILSLFLVLYIIVL